MNRPATTHALLLAVLVTFVAAAVAWTRLDAARAAARAAARDADAVRDDLRDLDAWHVTIASGDAAADGSDFNRRLRSAAAAAGLVDELVSVEPGPAVRVRDSDTVRTPVFLRLDGVTLRRLVSFLADLTRADASVRVTGVDLSAPADAPPGGEEIWTADVTLSASAVVAGGAKG